MSKVIFAKTVIAKISSMIGDDGTAYTSATRGIAAAAIGLGVAEYLVAHMKLNVAYAGVTPSDTPDVCSDVVSVVGTCGPVLGNTFEDWVITLQNVIMSGIQVSVGTSLVAPSGVFNAVPIPGLSLFLTQARIYAAHQGNYEHPQQPIWEEIGQAVIDWISIGKIPTYPATHITSTGVATVTSVTFI